MENYLDDKQFGEVEVYDCVERLKELGLIDDEKFAKDFVSTRLASKAVSKRHLREQLCAHFVSRDVIDTVLESIPDDTELNNAVNLAKKYYRQLASLPDDEREQRVMQRLQRRGYSLEMIKHAISLADKEAENEE